MAAGRGSKAAPPGSRLTRIAKHQRREMQRGCMLNRQSKSRLPTCECSSYGRPRDQPWPKCRVVFSATTNFRSHASKQRMRYTQMQIFDDLHVVTRYNDACV